MDVLWYRGTSEFFVTHSELLPLKVLKCSRAEDVTSQTANSSGKYAS